MQAFLHDGPTTTVCLVTFVTVAAVADLRCHRIPNWMTVSAALIGVTVNLLTSGFPGAAQSVAGLVVGLATFLPFYLLRGFGAGDVKAMAAVGAFVGPNGVLLAAGCTLIAGAVGAVLVLIAAGGLIAALRLACDWSMRLLAISSGAVPAPPPRAHGALSTRRFPYGLAIACGTVASLAWS